MLVNKIYLYDHNGDDETDNYKITIILNSGKDKVEITDKLYSDIQQDIQDTKLCKLNNSGHQSLIDTAEKDV